MGGSAPLDLLVLLPQLLHPLLLRLLLLLLTRPVLGHRLVVGFTPLPERNNLVKNVLGGVGSDFGFGF